jgi:hypothetical protein
MNIFEITLRSTPTTLVESVCKDLTAPQRRIVEGVVSELRPLFEAALTPDQISKIFTQAEQEVTAAGSNRSGVGKTVDATKAVGSAVGAAAGKVNNAINGLGQYLQTTAPVQYFDQKFEDLKQKISVKLGADSKTMAAIDKLGQYARANPGKTAFAIGALTAIASFATGPAGGAVAAQILRGATELLKGEKLSTAVGKGAKSAAIGGALGAGITALGDYFGNIKVVAQQIPGYTRLTRLNFIYEAVSTGGNGKSPGYFFGDLRGLEIPSQLAPKLKLLLDQTINYIDAGNWAGANKFWNEATAIVNNPEVQNLVKEIAGNNQKLIDQATADAANFKKVADTISSTLRAAVQGGMAGASAAPAAAPAAPPAPPAPAPAPANFNQVRENRLRLTHYEARKILAVAGSLLSEGPMDWVRNKSKNITTKITADKLNTLWKKEGSPTDSDHIAVILRRIGIDDKIISAAFNSVGAPLPSFVSKPATEPAAQSGTDTAQATATAQPTATAQDQGANVFGNMAQTMKTMQPTGASSTGGSVTQTPTGLKHTAKTAGNTVEPGVAPTASAAGIGQKFTKAKQAPISKSTSEYKTPLEVVDSIMKTAPKDWLPEITAELLKRQQVGANKR